VRWRKVEGSAFGRCRLSVDLTAASLIWLVTCSTAGAQTGTGDADNYTAVIEGICREYAAAQTAMPTELMFKQCMSERHAGHHRAIGANRPGPWHGMAAVTDRATSHRLG